MPSNLALAAPSRLLRLLQPIGFLLILALAASAMALAATGRQVDVMTANHQSQLIDRLLGVWAEQAARELKPLAARPLGPDFDAAARAHDALDAVFVLSPAEAPLYAAEAGKPAEPILFEHYREAAAAAVADARAPARGAAPASRLERLDGAPVLITAAPMQADGASRPNLIVSLQRLTPAMLSHVAENFGLDDLKFAAPGDERRGFARHEMRDARGDSVVALAWRPEQPGRNLLGSMAPLLAPLAAIVLIFAVIVMVGADRFAQGLEIARRDAEHRAEHDDLTGLYNRAGFVAQLDIAMARGSQLAVAAIDLDRFKDLNDTFGHLQGDDALRQVSLRLARALPPEAVLARLGGDEFIAILPSCGVDEAARICDLVRSAVSAPLRLPCGAETQLGASFGVALAPTQARNCYELLRVADVALYRAKALGRGRVVVFDPSMDEEFAQRRRIEDALRGALARDEISMAYQPIMSQDGSQVASVEALMRWDHPELGGVPPSEFVPIAEECGVIGELGAFALRTACRDARHWNVKVAVNVSSVQFRQGDVAELVERVLDETRFPANRLEIEITETAVLGDEMSARSQIERLRAIGVSVALDDFGAGYSSLAYLRRFGFDKLKIDQSYVADLGKSDGAATIVHAIVQMARAMNMAVTAEGVESRTQHAFLHAAGCHFMQGFMFAPPMRAEALKLDAPAPAHTAAQAS